MNYLEVNTNQRSTNSRIRRYRLFPYHSREQMLQLHLYFVKLFGCVISAMSAPLNIGSFAEAINRRHASQRICGPWQAKLATRTEVCRAK
jgi:hypothetical protein